MVSNSSTAVQINGKTEVSKLLRDGDRLDCGGKSFLLRRPAGQWELQDLDTTVRSVYEAPDSSMALLDTLVALTGQHDLDHLLPLILKASVEVLDADQGVLEIPEVTKPRLEHPAQATPISASAVARAREKRQAVIWNQSDASTELDLSRSMVQNQLSSILVAPFSHNKGFLYLQRRARATAFSARDCDVFGRFVQVCEHLLVNMRTTIELRAENTVLRKIQERNGIVFSCEAMEKVMTLATKVAATPVPVVIEGDTGTGKEGIARFIHQNSPRAAKPFVAINCGAIPASLIESILFGYIKGAFTGANETRKGVFEEADGGTLFLDEIAELPLELQVKLLRVLQEKRLTRVGDSKEINIDVRILSASHKKLEDLVREQKMREDLFFRLSVMLIQLPPLRDRGQDVLLLARRFLERFMAEFGMESATFSKAAEKALVRHDWPGNVRELENRVQKALVQCEAGAIEPADLGLEGEMAGSRGLRTLIAAKEAAERECADRALRDAKGNLTLAGQILGIDRKVLRDLMERLGIQKETYRENENS
jgi:DNA-binding NtrC family response regulator